MRARQCTWRAAVRRLTILAAVTAVTASSALAQTTLLQFSTTGLSGTESSLAASTTAAGIAAGSVVTRSSGLNATSGTNAFMANNWVANNATNDITTGKYFTFSVAPAANFNLALTGLAGGVRATTGGPSFMQYVTVIAGSTASIGSAVTTNNTDQSISAVLTNSGITGPVEFRLVGWRTVANANSATGTGRFGNATNATTTLSGSATLRSAGTLTWDGGRGNGSWGAYDGYAANQSNWDLNNVPSAALVDSLTFAGAAQTTTSNNVAGLTVGSITFAAGAAAFTNSGSAITLTGGITNNSSNLQTIGHAIALSAGTHAVDVGSGSISLGGPVSGSGASMTKAGPGTLTLTASNSFTGGVTVAAGRLVVGPGGSLAGNAVVDAVLGGGGLLAGTISGSGSVDPGSSPGILTAGAVDPTGGLDHAFEFTAPAPDYTTTGTAALNDVLHLTAATPFTTALSAAAGNAVNVYFNLASGSLSPGQTIVGGFFTDSAASPSAFLADVAAAQFNFFVASAGGGTNYEGVSYRSLADWNTLTAQNLQVTVGGTAVTGAAFPTGTTNGYVTTFAVVPEPSTLALAGIVPVVAGWFAWRRRRPRAGETAAAHRNSTAA